MARTQRPHSGTEHDPAVPEGAPDLPSPRTRFLFPVGIVILALLMGLLIFNATRSGPNYQEEEGFTPDPVQEAD